MIRFLQRFSLARCSTCSVLPSEGPYAEGLRESPCSDCLPMQSVPHAAKGRGQCVKRLHSIALDTALVRTPMLFAFAVSGNAVHSPFYHNPERLQPALSCLDGRSCCRPIFRSCCEMPLPLGPDLQVKSEVEGFQSHFLRSQWFCQPVGAPLLSKQVGSWSSDPTNPVRNCKSSCRDPVAIIPRDPVACRETRSI